MVRRISGLVCERLTSPRVPRSTRFGSPADQGGEFAPDGLAAGRVGDRLPAVGEGDDERQAASVGAERIGFDVRRRGPWAQVSAGVGDFDAETTGRRVEDERQPEGAAGYAAVEVGVGGWLRGGESGTRREVLRGAQEQGSVTVRSRAPRRVDDRSCAKTLAWEPAWHVARFMTPEWRSDAGESEHRVTYTE